MHESDPIRYHRESLDFIEVTPEVSLDLCGQLDKAASERGMILPEAYREWFSLENGEKVLSFHSNDDPAFSLLNAEYRDVIEEEQQLSKDYLVFSIENQGVYTWGVFLDGSANPAVFQIGDDGEKVKVADSFSSFIFGRVYEWCDAGMFSTVKHAKLEVSEVDLIFLKQRFQYIGANYKEVPEIVPVHYFYRNGIGLEVYPDAIEFAIKKSFAEADLLKRLEDNQHLHDVAKSILKDAG